MELQIKDTCLSDAPFGELNKDLFTLPHPEFENLVLDIKNGTPTCYLISGYRGAGKSSFINRIKNKVNKNISDHSNKSNNAEKTNPKKEIVFAHINFSRYQNQTFLLRKLIRELYLAIKDLESFKKIKDSQQKKPLEERTILSLEDLYEKTFYDTSYNITNSNKEESVSTFNIDFLSLIKLVLPFIAFILITINWIFDLFKFEILINILTSIFTSFLAVKQFLKIKKEYSKSNTEQNDFNRKSMYDDEIADHHFFSVIKTLQNINYKIVFVLDELDKVDDEELEDLLKELKPYLVSGCASFIAVAGQKLFYKYLHAKSIDDDILSSIFSKTIHIPLFTRDEFRDLFVRLIKDLPKHNKEEKVLLDSYIDYLVFEAKRVPRKFISLVREQLKWKDTNSYIEIEQTSEQLQIYTKSLDIIDKINDEEIETIGFNSGLRDYFIMQLHIKIHKIIFSKKPHFTKIEILEIGTETQNKASAIFKEDLNSFLERFINRLLHELEIAQIISKLNTISEESYQLIFNQTIEPTLLNVAHKDVFNELSEFKTIIQNIYRHLEFPDSGKSGDYSLSKIISKFNDRKIIDAPWVKKKEIVTILDKLGSSTDNKQNISNDVEKTILDNKINTNTLTLSLLEYYGIESAKKFFSTFDYLTKSENQFSDLVMTHSKSRYPNLIFEFKFRKNSPLPSTEIIVQSLKKLEEFSTDNENNYQYFLVIFTQQNSSSFDRTKFLFTKELEKLEKLKNHKDKIHFIPISTHYLHLINDEFKNFKEQNIRQDFKLKFTAQNPTTSHPERNDHFLDQIFELKKSYFKITLNPGSTQFWRFGFTFSKSEVFSDISEPRHLPNYPDIHIKVGDLEQLQTWVNPHHLDLMSYNTKIISGNFSGLNNYKGEPIQLTVSTNDDSSLVQFILYLTDVEIGKRCFNLSGFKFCKLSAWCDYNPFELDAEINVIHK